MSALRRQIYLIPAAMAADTLLERLAAHFDFEPSGVSSGDEHYFDTFDWRLYRRSMVCCISGKRLRLRGFDGRDLAHCAVPAGKRCFWWELEAGAVADTLKKYAEMRALCPTVSLHRSDRRYKVLNQDRKTVARFRLRTTRARSGEAEMELPESLAVQEIRGYGKPFARITQACVEAGLHQLEDNDSLLERAYGISPRQPLDYGAKFSVELDHGVAIGAAIAAICLNLVETMERNLAGLLADIDSEFLHDFRIAVRRTRSLLSLMKKVLPAEEAARFRAEFKWLGGVTGPVRDIDVYLLEQERYRRLVPPALRSGLDLFFEELADRRGRELEALRGHLGSPRYHDLISEWRLFLSEASSPLFAGERRRPCRPLVTTIIGKHHKRLLRDGDRITDTGSDKQLHRLRIKGKKFRYLLEFFRSFYNDDDLAALLKQLKKLQDNLGEFNDLTVQKAMLSSTLTALTARNRRTIRLAAALGGLIARLSDRHAAVRSQFRHTYDEFRSAETRNLVGALLAEDADCGGQP